MASLPSHVGIVGLGLMGGSLARDLVDAGVRVTAFDHAADPAWQLPDGLRLALSIEQVVEAPLVVLAVPVVASEQLLSALRPHLTSAHTIVDVGSTKVNLAMHARALGIGERFVGCHPFAGDHRSGWNASRVGLFAGATIFVCPSSESAPDTVATATALWAAVGGVVELDDPVRHDQRMALASHLPHLLSVTLARTLHDSGVPHSTLGPGGRDVARLAGGSPDMWVDIVAQNRSALCEALALYARRFSELRHMVESGDDQALYAILAQGRQWHSASSDCTSVAIR